MDLSTQRSFLTPLAVLVFAVSGLLVGYAMGYVMAWIIPLGIVIGCMLIGRPRALLLFYFIWSVPGICSGERVVLGLPWFQYIDELFCPGHKPPPG